MIAALMSIPEIAEAVSPADAALALDDVGWVTPGNTHSLLELNPRKRSVLVNQSRFYWLRDPLAKQAVRLWTDYCFGDQGMSFETEDSKAQKILDTFINSRTNKRLTSAAGQQRLSKKLLVDGDVFFVIFGATGNYPQLRTIDPLQITDLVADPEDEEEILCYRRETRNLDGTVGKVLFYADWKLDEEGIAKTEKLKDPQGKTNIELQRDDDGELVVVYHLPFDSIGNRGNGLLTSVIDWTRSHRMFMQARVTLVESLSKFAWKLTAKIGQKGVDAIAAKLNSSITGGNMIERKPPAAPGSTYVGNSAADMVPMPRTTGGGEAKDDGNNLKLMVCAGTGIMLHYFGDPSTGNLATSTAMELPMLKQFGGYQQLWKDAWRDIFSVVLQEIPGEDPLRIDISLPEIVGEALRDYGTYIQAVATIFPEAKVPSVLKTLLSAINVENLDEVMDEIADNKIELDKKAEELQKKMLAGQPPAQQPGQPALPPKPGEPAPAKTSVVNSDAEAIAALDRLAAAIKESPEHRHIPMPQEPYQLAITVEAKS